MNFTKQTYFLITGASKGIGKCMAIECSKKLPSGSLIVLMARSLKGLEETKTEIQKINQNLQVKVYAIDLSTAESKDYEKVLKDSLTDKTSKNFELAFIIHNVGSIGNVAVKAKDFDNVNEWNSYYKLNVFSVAALNSEFIKTFQNNKKLIVNITSKCGLVPFKSMALYCSGKAAREMYFRVLAEEEPEILVLNYSPGPVDTDMSKEIQFSSSDADIKEFFKSQRESKQILTPIQTTTKFLEILEGMKFKSGDHVDYFD